jgi:transposase
MEARAGRKVGEQMAEMETEQRDVDLSCVDADLRTGMFLRAAARKYGLPESTLRIRLKKAGYATSPPRPTNGKASDPDAHPRVERPRQKGNGNGANGHSTATELQALEEIINARWQRLALPDRLRILLQA